jgi:hypothetical protein
MYEIVYSLCNAFYLKKSIQACFLKIISYDGIVNLKQEKSMSDGALSQDEIDALLAGVDCDVECKSDPGALGTAFFNNVEIVLTAFGSGQTVNEVSVDIFRAYEKGRIRSKAASLFCEEMKKIPRPQCCWVHSKSIEGGKRYDLKYFRNRLHFEDLIYFDDRAIQKIAREASKEILVVALKSTEDNLVEKILKNVSKRTRKIIQEDMYYMGPVRLCDIKDTQEEIMIIAEKLENAGEIVVSRINRGNNNVTNL